MFQIPVKHIIVNSDDQVELLNGSSTALGSFGDAYADGAVTTAAHTVIMKGLLDSSQEISQADLVSINFNGATSEVHKIAPTADVAQVSTFQVTAGGNAVGDTFRLVFESIDGTPSEYQNEPITKIYQVGGTLTTAANVAAAIDAAIKADDDPKVSSSVTTDTVTITALDAGVRVNVYSESIVGTETITTPAAIGVGTFRALSNIEWSKNFDFDRNQEYSPLKGSTYAEYIFNTKSTGFIASSGGSVPNEQPSEGINEFRLYVKVGSTLDTALTNWKGDLDAII